MPKQKVISVIIAILVAFNLNVAQGSSSDSFVVDDESVHFGSAGGYLSSDSFELDLNDLSWVSRYAASENYEVVDANSMQEEAEEEESPIVDPPISSSGGSSGGAGGGTRVVIDEGEIDNSIIAIAEESEERELNKAIIEEEEQEESEQIEGLSQENLEILEENPHYIQELEMLEELGFEIDFPIIQEFIKEEKYISKLPLAVIASLPILSELDNCNYNSRVILMLLMLSVLFNFYLLWKSKEKRKNQKKRK